MNAIRRYCIHNFGWTVKEVDEQPYYKLCELILDKEEAQQNKKEVVHGADFISRLA